MKTKPYRVVAGVDGSPAGVLALRWACRQAGAHDGVVDAVIVAPDDRPAGPGSPYRSDGERMLSEAIVAALGDNPRVTVHGRVASGGVAESLVTASDGADLLVLGDHRSGRLHRAALGTVAQACIRDARCPVAVVPLKPAR